MLAPIRVAADISGLSYAPRPASVKYGILRVLENALQHMADRPELAVQLVGFREREPLLSSYRAQVYRSPDLPPFPVLPTARSRFGLDRLHRAVLERYFQAWETQGLGGIPAPLRALTKVLKEHDCKIVFDPTAFDVFQSLNDGLPPRRYTGNLKRSLWIQDLICLRNPELVNADAIFAQKQTLVNFDRAHDYVLCTSEYVRQDVQDYLGLSAEQVFLAPLAASEHFFPRTPEAIAAAQRRYKLPAERYLMAVGDTQLRKNVATVLAAYRLLWEESDFRLPLVLQGKRNPDHTPLLEQLPADAAASVFFTGFVEDEDLPTLYSGAAVFLYPSLAEGFGLPILESMRCGTPVIVSDTTSLPEVAGPAGIVVPARDPACLAAAVQGLLNDEQRRAATIEAGLAWGKTFTWKRCVDGMIEQYRAILSQ